MPDIQEALRTYLLTKSGLTALIQNRIYPEAEAPVKAEYPYVFYQKISDIPDHTHDGQLSLRAPVIQYTSCGKTKATAKAVAAQLEAALADYSGTLSGLLVQIIRFENEMESTDVSPDGVVKIHFVDQEYEVNYVKT